MAYEVGLGSERLCTIKEIAEQSALGAGTVHRALKGGRLVSAETLRARARHRPATQRGEDRPVPRGWSDAPEKMQTRLDQPVRPVGR